MKILNKINISQFIFYFYYFGYFKNIFNHKLDDELVDIVLFKFY